MGKSQDFKATVNFGAAIDPSFGAAVSKIGEKMRDAADDAATSVNRLTKEQQKLRKEMEKGEKAGRDVSHLKAQYDELGNSIEKASGKLARYNALGKAGTLLGNTGRVGMAVARPALGAALLGGGAVAGIVTGAIAANAETALQLGKAQGYGLDFGTHMAYQGISKAIGLDEDAIGDLIDEMKNKVGEVGNEKMLDPLLGQIGMNKAEAKKMMKEDPNKLFREVMNRLHTAVKEGKMSAGEAGSMADQLFSGEAQKFMSYMVSMNKELDEMIKTSAKYNLLTEEGVRQAAEGQYALSSLWSVVTTGFSEVFGRILGAASTDILKGADHLKALIEAKTPEIVTAVTDWFKPDQHGENGPERLWETVTEVTDGLLKFGKVVMAVADKLDWLIKDEAQITEEQQVILDYIGMGNTYAGAELLARDYDLEDWLIKQRLDDPSVAANLRAQFKERHRLMNTPVPESALGISTPDTILPFTQRESGPINSNNQIAIHVVAAPGQSAEEVGIRTAEELEKQFPFMNYSAPGAPTWDPFG